MSVLSLTPSLPHRYAVVLIVAIALPCARSVRAQSTHERVAPDTGRLPWRQLRPPGLADSLAKRLEDAVARPAKRCPMPVAVPDTGRVEQMPHVTPDSTRRRPMPVAPPGCVNDLAGQITFGGRP